MDGKNHIICTTAMTATICVSHYTLGQLNSGALSDMYGITANNMRYFTQLDNFIWQYIGVNISASIKDLFTLALFFVFIIMGTLLVDCDSEKSILGRILHIPVEHRTWLHAIWIPAILFVTSFAIPNIVSHCLVWLVIGWLMHEFMDSFSACGNSYLYPIVGYRKYGNAKVKKGIHMCKFYRVGETSETVFVVIVVALCVLFMAINLIAPYTDFKIVGDGIGLLE